MSATVNRLLHLAVIRRAQRRYPAGHDMRLILVQRAIAGIRRSLSSAYNPAHD